MSENKIQESNQDNDEEIKKKVRALEIEDIKHHSNPMWLTNQYVDRTWVMLLANCLFFIVCLVIVAAAGLFSLSDQEDRDYLIWTDPKVITYDLKEEMFVQQQKANADEEVPKQSIEETAWLTQILLETKGSNDNLLTPEGIQYLYKEEQNIQKLKHYDQVCLADPVTKECIGVSSFTSRFTNIDSITQADIETQIDFVTDDANWDDWKHFFGDEFTKDNRKAKTIRTLIKLGAPITYKEKNYMNQFHKEDDQDADILEFAEKLVDLMDDAKEPKGIQFAIYSEQVSNIIFNKLLMRDFAFAIISIVLVWFYLTFHLKSLFLSSFGMIGILLSFPITLVIFKGIFQVKYFSTLHILIVFVILGIAADDIFVFIDAWRLTLQLKEFEGNRNRMMAFTFRRASKAMLATSSTTAAAFFATGLSDIMPISSFGIFAGIIVPINYLLVILFFPIIIIIHDRHLKHRNFMPCIKKKQPEQQRVENTENIQSHKDIEQVQQQQLNQNQPVPNENNDEKEHQIDEMPLLSKFFGGVFNTNINRFKIPILITFIVWICIAAWRVSLLSPITEPEEFLPSDHILQKAQNTLRRGFHASGEVKTSAIIVYWYWGAKKLDRSNIKSWDAKDRGKAIWDDDFDLSPEANQTWLLNFCQDMKNNDLVLNNDITCFMDDFKEYIETTLSETFPVPQSQFNQKLVDFVKTPKGQNLEQNQYIGFIKDDLKFIGIELVAVGEVGQPRKKMLPIYNKWNKLIKSINKEAPVGMNKSKQTAGISWAWMASEEAFVSNAISGMLLSLGFALIVLLLTSLNIFVSFYSVFCIAGIVVSVISVMEMNGWQLGIIESITIVILIGMSVDYVVHLANHYVESIYPKRSQKIQISLQEIGISIFSGAATTLLSGIALFFCVITLFEKFAILIVATIGFSMAFALIFFAALMHLLGPEGNQGNLKYMFNIARNKICPVKGEPVKQEENAEQFNKDTQKE